MPIFKFAWAMILAFVMLVADAAPGFAQKDPRRVLWFSAMPDVGREFTTGHRKKMADYVNNYAGGTAFNVTYRRNTSRGGLSKELSAGQFDILILDMTGKANPMGPADVASLQQFYGSGRRALMLDGSFAIRNLTHNPTTKFPGVNGSSAGLLMNQIYALSEQGGGILIGTDHDIWQPMANAALRALVPNATFRGTTNPSTNGDFIGTTLLASRVVVTARDVLKHWESVPNQGEAPVGQFADFMGQPIVLHSLVETADKPGGGRKRPYISASFSPGDQRIPIDSADEMFGDMPTHKSSR